MKCKKTMAASAAAALSVVGFGAAADAAPNNQRGLVNINASDITAQIPIGVAANICDVNVAVLAALIDAGGGDCTSETESGAIFVSDTGRSGNNQRGLVNVNLTDITVQVPIGVAANICSVNVAVLARLVDGAERNCNSGTGVISRVTG